MPFGWGNELTPRDGVKESWNPKVREKKWGNNGQENL